MYCNILSIATGSFDRLCLWPAAEFSDIKNSPNMSVRHLNNIHASRSVRIFILLFFPPHNSFHSSHPHCCAPSFSVDYCIYTHINTYIKVPSTVVGINFNPFPSNSAVEIKEKVLLFR